MGSLIAGVIVVLSPMAVAFSPTAFTDPLAVMWGTAAVLAAASKRYGKAGLFLGLGMATKYQAGLFSLLVVPLLASDPDRGRRVTSCGGAGAWARCAAGVLVPLSLVAGWDWARSGRLSLLETQWLSYGGLRFAYSEDLWPRLVDWLRLGRWVVGAKSVGLIVVALGIAWIASVAAGGRRRGSDGVGILLVFWLAAYGALHWLLEVPVWDRYLLPAVPVLAALAGWLVARLLGTGTVTWILVGVFLISMLPSSLASAQGKLPLGGDHGTFDGMEQVASFFADQPYGTVLYDHWLSWELYYYLFDSRVYISWFADPEALIRDLTAFGANSPRYLVIPAWEDAEPILRALDVAGFSALSALQAHRSDDSVAFLVWRIAGGT
jgi:hypothetical protein